MRNYDINNYYVGILNFCYPFGEYERDYLSQAKKDLFLETINNGAIDIRNLPDGIELDFINNCRIEKLFTLFYRVDDTHYLCLHNKKYYGNSDDYCNNLERLVNVLPKIDVLYKDNLSYHNVLKLFKYLFKYDSHKIYSEAKTEFRIEDFYLGTTSLCTGYYKIDTNPFKSKNYLLNLPQYLMYLNNNYLSLESGCSKFNNNLEYIYSDFNSLFIKTPKKKVYNLNDNCFYDLTDENRFATKVKLGDYLLDELEEKEIVYPSHLTIPKALKLQKKLYDRK